MVSELIKYRCDICNSVYNTKDEAINCESKGYEEEESTFKVGDCYDFVLSYIKGSCGKDDYEGIETVKITDIVKSHKTKYVCDVYDDVNNEWYMKDYVIEGNQYFKNWNRGRIAIK